MAFNRDKYKKIFEDRFGTGSYNAGLSHAKEIGRSTAQAEYEKDAYNERKKEYEKSLKNRTYSDALAYWSDPENKQRLQKDGAYRYANEIKNDPRLQEEIKSQGFNISDYIDAMYHAASEGRFRSEREYNEYSKSQKKQANERNDNIYSKYGISEVPKESDVKVPSKVEKPKKKNFFDDLGDAAKSAFQFFNPFDDVSMKEAAENFMNREKSDSFNEVARGANRAIDSATLSALSNLDKKVNNREPYYNSNRAFGEGGGTDMLTSGLGYLIPGVGAYKALGATKAGKSLEALGKIGTKQRLGAEAAKGAITGAGLGAAEVGIREGLNPQDYSAIDNLKHIGIGTAAGAIADPALYGLGKLAQSGLAKTLKGDVPTFTGKPSGSVLESLTPPKQEFNYSPDLLPGISMKSSLREKLPEIKPKRTEIDLESITAPDRTKVKHEAIEPNDDTGLIRVDKKESLDFDPTKLKDISGFRAATDDVYRIVEDVLGDKGKPILSKLDSAKKDYVDTQEKWLKKLKTEVVDNLGIKKGSKESALVQQYGEKQITLDELKKQAPDKWEAIVEADKWFRKAYDELIESVNKARTKIYPNNPEKLVPKRENYYRHFREMNGLTGLKNIFDSPAQIDPHLAGLSQHTNPNTKWASFMQKRGMGPYKNDAVGGFLEYIPAASYAQNIDRVIPEFKNLRKVLADGTEESKNLNNFIEFLYNYSNDLAGKTNPYFDRNMQQLLGRKPMAVLNWMNNRVKKNVILGNVGSALAQLANVPNGVAFAKQHSVRGIGRTFASIASKKAPIHKSPFIKERYIDGLYREFDERLIDKPEKMAAWLIETADRIGTSFVWNSAYEKGLKEGVKNPIKYADDNTRKLIAGRGVGEVPLMQKSKVVQLVMPFTLEVANLWHVMRDFAKAKDFGALATLFTANFLLNRVMEETRGSSVTFDPIDAIYDALNDEELNNVQKGGRLLGEVLTNVPIGQHLAGLYPEDGQLFNIKGPTRQELFGERNPQRFGTGLVAANSMTDPVFKFILPFGGNQLKKSLNGIEAIQDGGEYKKDTNLGLPFFGENEKLKYPVSSDVLNKIKGTLFGPSAFNEAREYYDNKQRPLSEKQTANFEELSKYGKGKEYYNDLMRERRIKTIENKIKEIDKDDSLTTEEKRKQIMILIQELQSLQ